MRKFRVGTHQRIFIIDLWKIFKVTIFPKLKHRTLLWLKQDKHTRCVVRCILITILSVSLLAWPNRLSNSICKILAADERWGLCASLTFQSAKWNSYRRNHLPARAREYEGCGGWSGAQSGGEHKSADTSGHTAGHPSLKTNMRPGDSGW